VEALSNAVVALIGPMEGAMVGLFAIAIIVRLSRVVVELFGG